MENNANELIDRAFLFLDQLKFNMKIIDELQLKVKNSNDEQILLDNLYQLADQLADLRKPLGDAQFYINWAAAIIDEKTGE
jgi:hypothetical protein